MAGTSSLPRCNTQFLPKILQGHERALTAIKYNKDGDLLFSSAKDKNPSMWYADSGELIGTYGPHGGAVWDIDPSWDSKYVLTACSDAQARIFEASTGNLLVRCPHKGPVRACTWSDSGKHFVTASDPFSGSVSRHWGTVNVFNFPPENVYDVPGSPDRLYDATHEIEIVENNKVICLAWTYGDQFVIAGFENGKIVQYDPTTGKELLMRRTHTDRVNQISFNKDKTLMITASRDGTAKVLDPVTLEIIREIKTERPVNGAVISPTHPHIILGGGQDAQTVTTTSSNQSQFCSRFYHLVYGEEFGRCKGHFGPINAIAIHPFGKSYVTASEDGFIRLMPFEASYLAMPDLLPDDLRNEYFQR